MSAHQPATRLRRSASGTTRVVIAGGGTGGHTSAGLAVAVTLLRLASVEIAWIGSRSGIEARRAAEASIPFFSIPAGKLRRYWDWQNVPDLLVRVPAGILRAWRHLRVLQPDVLFVTGGFVSLPPALAARALRLPIVVHEQTSVPGLANRIIGRFARRIAVTFPPADHEFPPDRTVLTGNPIRPALLGGSREEGCRLLGFDPGQPVIYVTGGAQGAHRINRVVGEGLAALLERTQVIHQSGDNPATGDVHWLEGRARALPGPLQRRYALRPYLTDELSHVFAAADLVVGRSGAGTVNECCHLGRPAVYIPLPGTSGDEQTENARRVVAAGGAVLLPQAQLAPSTLVEAVDRLLADRAALQAMGQRARSLAVPDAAERLARLVLEAAAP